MRCHQGLEGSHQLMPFCYCLKSLFHRGSELGEKGMQQMSRAHISNVSNVYPPCIAPNCISASLISLKHRTRSVTTAQSSTIPSKNTRSTGKKGFNCQRGQAICWNHVLLSKQNKTAALQEVQMIEPLLSFRVSFS